MTSFESQKFQDAFHEEALSPSDCAAILESKLGNSDSANYGVGGRGFSLSRWISDDQNRNGWRLTMVELNSRHQQGGSFCVNSDGTLNEGIVYNDGSAPRDATQRDLGAVCAALKAEDDFDNMLLEL